jgi:FHS family L-fucose permease-like MFS transporter
MTSAPHPAPSNRPGGTLFRTADGKNPFITFALFTSLLLLSAFCNGMIDILNTHFQDSLHINKAQSGLVQFANYIAYFVMVIPAGLLAVKFGYKGGIIVGLLLIAGDAFWFIPATHIETFWAFLAGLFIIAAGMTCLETIANPYATLLGATESGATRINIAQTFNGVGWILGPIVGGHFVFSGGEGANADAGLYVPYLGVGIVVTLLIAVFVLADVPDLHADEEIKVKAERKGTKPLWRRSHFTCGMAVQFLYVAAQTGIFSFFVKYVLENDPSVTKMQASTWLGAVGFGLFMFGRLCGSAVISLVRPHRVLATYAAINVVLTAVAMGGGKTGLYALFGTFFFMSVMFPTIFALRIRGLGEHPKLGSSLIVMSIVGGAIAAPLMGHIANISSMRTGFELPIICFIFIALYGVFWQKLEDKDRAA